MKRIGFVGYESTDIALYLARMFQNRGNATVVVDHTRRLLLMKNAGIPEELIGKSGMYRNVEIYAGGLATKFPKDALIIDYFSYNTPLPELKLCDIVIFVSDMMMCNAQQLKGIEIKEDAEKVLILRDAIPLKYKEKFLIKETGIEISKDNVFVIPYDENDYRSRCYMCMDKKHKLTGLSDVMKKTLLSLYLGIEKVELTRKETALLLKNA